MTDEALNVAPEAAPEAVSIEAPAPEAPSEAPAMPSRRDALQKAFDTLDGKEGQPRGPDGKFAPKSVDAQPVNAPKVEAPKVEAVKAPISDPPSRFSPDAKAAWAAAPEPVRGEIQRAITELESGLRQKDEQLAPLKPFFELAKQHGVSLPDTLGNYVRMEQLLARDTRAGLEAIARNMGMTLPEMIQKATGGQPTQPQGQAQGQPDPRDQQIAELKRELDSIKGTVSQTRETFVLREVEAFAAKPEHARFDELAPQIARLLQTGMAADLSEAYQMADRLNPAPQPPAPAPAVAQPPAPAPQKRPALSVTGAPGTGSNPGNRPPSSNRKEAIARAMGAVGLA